MPPKLPPADPLTGVEAAVVIQNGKAVRTTTQDIANKGPTAAGPKGDTGPAGAIGAKGDTGATGAKGDVGATGPVGAAGAAGVKGDKGDTGSTGAAGSPKRIERFSGTTNASGIASISFSPAFNATPDIDVIEGWSNDQMITGVVVPASTGPSGCQVQVMVSRGTLLLTSGPFQKAGTGVSITVRVLGN